MSDTSKNANLLALFEPFDDDWKSTTRSIRIDGTVTSVRLENFYWLVVAEIAETQGLQVPQLMTRLSKTAKSGSTEHTNFTSFIRVCCGRFLDSKRADSIADTKAASSGIGTAQSAKETAPSEDQQLSAQSFESPMSTQPEGASSVMASGIENINSSRPEIDASAKS